MQTEEIRLFRDRLRRLQRNLGWLWRSDAECCGITTAQCHALMEVGKRDEISLVELADSLGLDTSTLSRTIDGMVQIGLVERQANPDDRRYVSITLAERGKLLYANIDSTFNDYYSGVFALIPTEKHRQVLESFTLLEEAISKSSSRQCCQEESKQ